MRRERFRADPTRPWEGQPITNRSDSYRILARSPRYTIRSSWEQVFVEGRDLAERVTIGDFYGDPTGAAIDPAERWCLMVGCGLIAYRLASPWTDYRYDTLADQWWEHRRQPKNELWCSGVSVLDSGRFLATAELDRWVVEQYEVDAEERRVTMVRSWTDAARRFRTEYLGSLEGLRLDEVAVGVDVSLRFGGDVDAELHLTGIFWLDGDRRPSSERVETGKCADDSSSMQFLRGLVGRTVRQCRSGQDGSFYLSLEAVPPEPGHRAPRIFVSADEQAGSWAVDQFGDRLSSPGPVGWSEDPPD